MPRARGGRAVVSISAYIYACMCPSGTGIDLISPSMAPESWKLDGVGAGLGARGPARGLLPNKQNTPALQLYMCHLLISGRARAAFEFLILKAYICILYCVLEMAFFRSGNNA